MSRHKITLFGKNGVGFGCRLWLDGRELAASRLELVADVNEIVTAVITLPAVLLEIEVDVDYTVQEAIRRQRLKRREVNTTAVSG